MKLVVLHPRCRLYHGTSRRKRFAVPRPPAWFAFTPEKAWFWAEWAHDGGKPRVLEFEVARPVELPSTAAYADWLKLADAVGGDSDDQWDMAKAVKKAGLPGWYGLEEVLLTDPEEVLVLVEARNDDRVD